MKVLLYKNSVTVLRNVLSSIQENVTCWSNTCFFATCSSLQHRWSFSELPTASTCDLRIGLSIATNFWGMSSFSYLTNSSRRFRYASPTASTFQPCSAVLGSCVSPTLLIAFLKKTCSCCVAIGSSTDEGDDPTVHFYRVSDHSCVFLLAFTTIQICI